MKLLTRPLWFQVLWGYDQESDRNTSTQLGGHICQVTLPAGCHLCLKQQASSVALCWVEGEGSDLRLSLSDSYVCCAVPALPGVL